MATIYQTIYDEILRKKDNDNFNDYLDVLIRLYQPDDVTKDKQNLLTIYLNATKGFTHLSLFLDKGFLLQPDKIEEPALLDHIILNFLNSNNLQALAKSLPKAPNSCYALLCLPTKYRLKLFEKSYQPSFKFFNSHTHLINDMFSQGKINCKNQNEFFEVIKDISYILKTIYSDKGLKAEHFETLTNDKTTTQFINQIVNFRFASGVLDKNDTINSFEDLSKISDIVIQHAHFTLSFDDVGVNKAETFANSILGNIKMDILLPKHNTKPITNKI